jgi:hypothetical protein
VPNDWAQRVLAAWGEEFEDEEEQGAREAAGIGAGEARWVRWRTERYWGKVLREWYELQGKPGFWEWLAKALEARLRLLGPVVKMEAVSEALGKQGRTTGELLRVAMRARADEGEGTAVRLVLPPGIVSEEGKEVGDGSGGHEAKAG